MNKFTKASIATGAGIVLLLGGAGTLAYWNDSATTSAGSITAGTLGITSTAAGTWYDVSSVATLTDPEVQGTAINPATFHVVPGDTLVYVESFTVAATGDNLEATIAADPASIVKGTWAGDLTASTALTIGGSTVSTITQANNNATVKVFVTLAFNFDSVVENPATTETIPVNNDSQSTVVDLSALAIVVTQVP